MSIRGCQIMCSVASFFLTHKSLHHDYDAVIKKMTDSIKHRALMTLVVGIVLQMGFSWS